VTGRYHDEFEVLFGLEIDTGWCLDLIWGALWLEGLWTYAVMT
jgi:hypothetical protein